jgi:hypothetical protein
MEYYLDSFLPDESRFGQYYHKGSWPICQDNIAPGPRVLLSKKKEDSDRPLLPVNKQSFDPCQGQVVTFPSTHRSPSTSAPGPV